MSHFSNLKESDIIYNQTHSDLIMPNNFYNHAQNKTTVYEYPIKTDIDDNIIAKYIIYPIKNIYNLLYIKIFNFLKTLYLYFFEKTFFIVYITYFFIVSYIFCIKNFNIYTRIIYLFISQLLFIYAYDYFKYYDIINKDYNITIYGKLYPIINMFNLLTL